MIVILHAAHNAHIDGGAADLGGTIILSIISKLGAGVPMFFVISGYCIAATSDSSRRRPSAPYRFFSRRFRRIFPPYWAMASFCLFLTYVLTIIGKSELVSDDYGLLPHPARLSPWQWFGNLTLTETWRPRLLGDAELKIIGPAWTLCYEEQFYAVCGLLLILAPRRFFTGTAVVTVITLILAPFGGPTIRGFFFDGRWLMFAEGVAVYYLLNYRRSHTSRILAFASLLAVAALFRYGLINPAEAETRNRAYELVVSSAFGLILILLHPWDRRMAGARALRPLAACGTMCYSLYLAHWPITIVLTAALYRSGVRGLWPTLLIVAPLAIISSLAASWLFHRTIERHFLNSSKLPAGPVHAGIMDLDKSANHPTPGPGNKPTPV